LNWLQRILALLLAQGGSQKRGCCGRRIEAHREIDGSATGPPTVPSSRFYPDSVLSDGHSSLDGNEIVARWLGLCLIARFSAAPNVANESHASPDP
jgi:hypothetical protein